MPRSALAALGLAVVLSVTGCASSRSLLDEPPFAGGSERFVRPPEQVFEATLSVLEEVGLDLDEVLDAPEGGRVVLASRGWGILDYGAIARVIVAPADAPEAGTWVRVTSRLKMRTNLAGKSDYREDVFSGVHAALLRGSGRAGRDLPPPVLAPHLGDPLVVGTPLRVGGIRALVREVGGTDFVLDDGLGAEPWRLSRGELDARVDVERLLREPYRWGRLLSASAIGVGLGAVTWWAYDATEGPYSGDVGALGAVTGTLIAATGIIVGAVWGNRARRQWRSTR